MKNRRQILQCKTCPITYTLVIKKVKNINMRIDRQGDVVVSANPLVPISRIDEFVSSRRDWIEEHRRKIMSRQEICEEDSEFFMLFGRKLKIKICTGKASRITYDDQFLYLQIKEHQDPQKQLAKCIDQLCRDVYTDIIGIMRKSLREYAIPDPILKIRTMTSRWGSCIPSKQQITLNRRLIHYPIEFIEYVVLHELVHFVQPNHSKAFYAIVESHMSDYRKRIALVS